MEWLVRWSLVLVVAGTIVLLIAGRRSCIVQPPVHAQHAAAAPAPARGGVFVSPAAVALRNRATTYADVAERVSAAVVNIATSSTHPLGSGVIVGRHGVVLTNNHVIDGASPLRVTLTDGRELDARVVGTDARTDLAVLQLVGDLRDLRPLSIGNSDRVRAGDVVLAVGSPRGGRSSITMGIVSGRGRGGRALGEVIETDAAIGPGSSGGALVDTEGRLIGIASAMVAYGFGRPALGLAIPARRAWRVARAIREAGVVTRGWLGATVQNLDSDLRSALGVRRTVAGALVADVDPGSPAQRAGVRRGDIVLSIRGEATPTAGRLRDLVSEAGARSTTVGLLRGSTVITRTVKLQTAPAAPSGAKRPAPRRVHEPLFGLTVRRYNARRLPLRLRRTGIGAGLVVRAISPYGPARDADVFIGDIIVEVDRRPVSTARDLAKALRRAGSHALLLVVRDRRTRFVTLTR